jgi:hypothetical protein
MPLDNNGHIDPAADRMPFERCSVCRHEIEELAEYKVTKVGVQHVACVIAGGLPA